MTSGTLYYVCLVTSAVLVVTSVLLVVTSLGTGGLVTSGLVLVVWY